MPAVTLGYRDGKPYAGACCNGCGQYIEIERDMLPALLSGSVVRGLLSPFCPVNFAIPGVYFGPCCADAARKLWERRGAALIAKGNRRGK